MPGIRNDALGADGGSRPAASSHGAGARAGRALRRRLGFTPALERNPGLRRLLIAFAVVHLCESGFITALSVRAFEIAGTLAVGLLGIRLLTGAVSGVLISPRFEDSPAALAAISAGRVLLLAGASVLAVLGLPFGLTLALVGLDAVIAAGYRPAHQRLLPVLARSPRELMRAVAGTSTTKTTGQAFGAALGGFASDLLSPTAAMLAFSLLLIIPLVCGVGLVRAGGVRAERARPAAWRALRAFPEVLGDANRWPLVAAGMLRTLLRGVWSALLVAVALRLLVAGRPGVGLLQSAAGLGAVLTLPLVAALIGRRRLAATFGLAFALAGLAMAGLALSAGAPVGLALICVWGAAMSVADVTAMSLLHRLFHPGALSRTLGVMEASKMVSQAAGALLAPTLATVLGLRDALLLAGLPLPALVLVTWRRIRVTDLVAEGRIRMVSRLHGVALFQSLNMASIEEMASVAMSVEVEPGADIITQGEADDCFYVIDSGEVDVLIDGYFVGRMGPGRGFGERALLRNARRSATVRAATATRLYSIERARFLAVVTGSAIDELSGGAPPPLPARDLRSIPIPDLLGEVTSLAGIGPDGLAELATVADRRRHAAEEVVFEEGDDSDAMHVILEGTAEVMVNGQVVAVLLPGDCFGEIGVLHRSARTSTVRARERLELVSLPGPAVLEAIAWAGG